MLKNIEGHRLPQVTFKTRDEYEWVDLTTDDIFAGKSAEVSATLSPSQTRSMNASRCRLGKRPMATLNASPTPSSTMRTSGMSDSRPGAFSIGSMGSPSSALGANQAITLRRLRHCSDSDVASSAPTKSDSSLTTMYFWRSA